jgi:hypothetical protein
MEFPELCIGICTYKRPWYGMMTINALAGWLHYSGPVRFHIADGGSPQEDIDYYKLILRERRVTVEVTSNLADMVNSCARNGGDYWMVVMDDYVLRYPLNITPDVMMLAEHPEIGCVRMGRLAYWGAVGNGIEVSADLVQWGGLHWWRLDKARTNDPYMSSIGAHLYHRRWWDAYGDIPACPPNHPGLAETQGNVRFRQKEGPTVAVPMRLGEDYPEHYEPFNHLGIWRTDEYKQTAGSRL